MNTARDTMTRVSTPAWLPNILAFQAGWWAVVLAAANGMPALGIAVVAASLAWHLTRVRRSKREALLIAAAGSIGLVFDSALQAAGWVAFAGAESALAPAWMVALWANFALTLNVSLRFLQARPLLAAALGAVGGPAAYWGGAALGAMQFLDVPAGLVALAAGWALLTPLLLALAGTLEARERT